MNARSGGGIPDASVGSRDVPVGRSRLAIVTGGTSGLGREIARELALHGDRVVIVGRNADQLAEVRATIDQEVGRAAVETVATTDLGLLSEARRVGTTLARAHPSVDLLVNNAGAIFSRRALTPEGQERTLALNVLAPFVLTSCLLPSLAAAAPSRVVNIASAAHRQQHLDLHDLGLERRFSAMRAYGRSKLGLILLTREFARRFPALGVAFLAVHPGFVRTNFGQNNHDALALGLRLASVLFATSVARGADTPVFAATDPAVEGLNGIYLVRRSVRSGSRASQDMAVATRLFDTCRSIAGVDPDDLLARRAGPKDGGSRANPG